MNYYYRNMTGHTHLHHFHSTLQYYNNQFTTSHLKVHTIVKIRGKGTQSDTYIDVNSPAADGAMYFTWSEAVG